MIQTMRWFGPNDPVALRDIRQAGAREVVTALHELPPGTIWPTDAIRARRTMIEAAGLGWSVVESLSVHEQIKTRGPRWNELIDGYRRSLTHLAQEGIHVVTYNFMPLLDWTRTDLAFAMADGSLALRFEIEAFCLYDTFILCRENAERDYEPAMVARARERFERMDEDARKTLEATIIAGLPGSDVHFTSAQLRDAIGSYADIDASRLREHHVAFLEAVCPVADALGLRLVVHPDDPPFPLFGLPRVVSTAADLAHLFERVPSDANGLCFCTGSLGARADNDLGAMVDQFGSRIRYLHLRSVQRETDRTFHEADHLEGNAQLVEIVARVHSLLQREGRSIAMRPDHGHQMSDDLNRQTNPGYSLIGRLRGLAELRGMEHAIAHMARSHD